MAKKAGKACSFGRSQRLKTKAVSMACRNLTKKFIDFRNGAKANRSLAGISSGEGSDTEKGLLNNNSGDSVNWKASRNTLPPAWVDKMEQVEEDINKIQSKIRDLNALHTKRLMVNFEVDEVQQEREIDFKTHEITEIFHHAESILKRFGRDTEDPSTPAAERTVRKNMQMSIARKLQGLSMSFRGSQKQYLTRLQAQKAGSGDQTFDFLAENNKKAGAGYYDEVDGDTGFTNAQLQILEDTEDLVNQRDEEITKIAKSIEELAQIFKELAVLVIDQGTILDRIDYNMEHAVEHAKEGVKQLEKAEEHQKKNLAIKCIILLIILIIIMLGVLIWKHSDTSSSKSKNN